MTSKNAEILALEALGWLAGEEDGLTRFLAQSGLDSQDLRSQAGTPEMAAAVLDFLLAQEVLLLAFCEANGVEPKDVHAAQRAFSKEGLREI